MTGTGNGKRFLKFSSVIGANNSVANSSRRGFRDEIDSGRSWKPVMFGEHQDLEEILPMQVSTAGPTSSPPSSKQQTGTDTSVSPPLANVAVDNLMKDGNNLTSSIASLSPLCFGSCGGGLNVAHYSRFGVAGNESDCDVRRVPELSAKTKGGVPGLSHTQDKGPTGSSHRKRGGASADKEHKRLKRSSFK
jgi:hypothetical protein